MVPKTFSIVIVGNMNPAIHHPEWYRAGGSLTPEQSEAIAKRAAVVMVPNFTRFASERWQIDCEPNRWSISTRSSSTAAEVLDIACTTFERLKETPISAFGLNYDHVGVLVGSSVPFERLMSTLNLESYVVREVQLSRALDPISLSGVTLHRQLNVNLEVKTDAPVVLHSNVHHEIKADQPGYHFDLSPLLRSAYTDATSVTGALADAILVLEESHNVHNS